MITITSLKVVTFSAPIVGLVSHNFVSVLQDFLAVLANSNVTVYKIWSQLAYLVFIFFCYLPFKTVHYSTLFPFTTGELPIYVNLMKLMI